MKHRLERFAFEIGLEKTFVQSLLFLEYVPHISNELMVYLLIDLDVNLVPLSVAANQRRGLMEIINCDWLLLIVKHD